MTDRPVYLDYAATTPVDPAVAAAMFACLSEGGDFGNASSVTHVFGQRAAEHVEAARAEERDSLQLVVDGGVSGLVARVGGDAELGAECASISPEGETIRVDADGATTATAGCASGLSERPTTATSLPERAKRGGGRSLPGGLVEVRPPWWSGW